MRAVAAERRIGRALTYGEGYLKERFGDRVDFHTLERRTLEITAFEHPRDYGEHFKQRFGPTIVAQANAREAGRETEFNNALNQFCDQWNLGTADKARLNRKPARDRNADVTPTSGR